MGFKNNFAYVQKRIDGLLKPFKYAKTYVHDIVIFNQILKKHAEHFNQIFGFSNEINIVLKPSK